MKTEVQVYLNVTFMVDKVKYTLFQAEDNGEMESPYTSIEGSSFVQVQRRGVAPTDSPDEWDEEESAVYEWGATSQVCPTGNCEELYNMYELLSSV